MQVITTITTQERTFRLRDSFLEPYYKKGDPFATLLARSTYLTKYSRGGEAWTDTIRRVVEGNIALAPTVSEREAELLFNLFWTGQAFPPGRGLWVGGIAGIPADARYNCFSKETRFWANGRLASFEEAVGQTVEVLSADGQWRPAEVKCFGKQALRTIRMAYRNSNFAFEFTATPNHRWITRNRGTVDDLRVGDRVVVTPRSVNQDTDVFRSGFAHGFVFGDGTKETLKQNVYKVRLCGEKDLQHEALLKSVQGFYSKCTPPSYNGDPVLFFRSDVNLKELPAEDTSLEYQAGFLAGWLAADGSIRPEGKKGGNRLSSQNASGLQWVADRAPLLGYCVTGWHVFSNAETNFGPRSSPLGQLTVVPEAVEYTVRSITDEGREEDVYCVVEPETHTFTLAGGVPTGNCWATSLYSIDDWCWVANQLMLGGGVGVNLHTIDQLPVVAGGAAKLAVWCRADHPNLAEVAPNAKEFLNGTTPVYVVPDSREGWIDALRQVLEAAWQGQSLIMDVSAIRERGQPIRTFGGIACGPGPLTNLLRSVWEIVRGAAGRKLNSVECLDITNLIGFCVKSGNVRRSALIVLGDPEDRAFRDAKKDYNAIKSHRHTSNNSLAFKSWSQIRNFDWRALVEDNATFGEPGILNLPLIWKTDPGVTGINPCGEIPLHDREACNLAEAFPAMFDGRTEESDVFRLLTRYCLRQRLSPLLDAKADAVRTKNMRLGVGLGGICDFEWTPYQLADWFLTCRKEASNYADELGVARPNAVTTTKPSGTISLLNGSSPGVHAPYAPYYIRRARIAKNDPMAPAMIEAGVPHEEDIYDHTGHTWVFAFPMKARHTNVTVQSETIRDQFKRQADVQEWWADNAVSATLSFEEHEKEELVKCFSEYVPRLKSTSCLPKAHGYKQAPYEAVDEATYRTMASTIRNDHKLVAGGEFEVDECSSGVCPIR